MRHGWSVALLAVACLWAVAQVPSAGCAPAAPVRAASSERLVVVECFMRDICPNCAGVGEVLGTLTTLYEPARLLVVEHDNDNRKGERYERWLDSGVTSSSLPLCIVDSGRWAFGGPVGEGSEAAYAALLEAAMARPARADLAGTTAREGDELTVKVRVRNLSGGPLSASGNGATLHALVFESARIHILPRFVRAAAAAPLEPPLAEGASGEYEVPLGPLPGLDWDTAELVVLLDARSAGAAGPYELLQAGVVSVPAQQRHPPVTDRLTSGSWTIDLVDRHGVVGTHAALALDALGRPHIAYRHVDLWALRHAWRVDGRWNVETVDDEVDAGQHADLAIGRDGRLYVSYYDRTHGDLRVAIGREGAWQIETVDAVGDVGWYASIALDSADRPRVCYVDAGTGVLRYAERDAAGWRTETVDTNVNQGAQWSLAAMLARLASIAVDTADHAHIAYYDDHGSDLHYAVQTGSGWRREVVDAAAFSGVDASIALDRAGRPRIAYSDYINDRLKLATRMDYSWRPQLVDDQGLVGMGASLALDGEGRAHIAYREYGPALGAKVLRYARETAGGWEVTTVDPGPKAGRYPSIVVDAVGEALIAYYDDDFQNLRYAERALPVPWPTASPTPEPSPTITPTADPSALPTASPGVSAREAFLPAAHRRCGALAAR